MEESYKNALERIEKVKIEKSAQLNLSGLKLTEFPHEIFELDHLTDLDLYDNKLKFVPKDIGKLINLKTLYLNRNLLSKLPNSIVNLTNLRVLNLGRNRLISIPDTIEKLIKLRELDLSKNQLSSISHAIGELINLRILVLDDNQLTSLPESIGKLTSLNKLDLYKNRLTILPKSIGKLTNLTKLILHSNQLTTIPRTVGKLKSLTLFDLSGNRLTAIPENISMLTNLTYFYLSENHLITIPETLKNLNNLVYLRVEGNLFEVGPETYKLHPKEQIQEILKWQSAQKAGTLEPIHEAKVIFIGESNYGKTHLIEFLRKGEIKREITTTHGIERSQMTVPFQNKNIRLNIWDLGGQEFMRSTHQFFFSERTLYVLVALARRERNDLNHWLKLANQLGNKAPVLVVINKIDANTHDLDRKSLERDYPNIIGFVRTSIYDCDEDKAVDTLDRLKKKIAATVSDKAIMPSVFEERPPQWFAVKDELEKLEAEGTDFITYEEYEKLDFIKDLPEDERKINLKLLSMIGAVVSYVDDPRLIDTNVINPQWIMDGVYSIINDPIIKDGTKGKLHIKDLGRILPNKKFPEARHTFLLGLMQKFDLCYAAKNQRDTYFIPDLFDDIEPDSDWDSANSLHFRYDYDDFVPNAFMTRFIVDMHLDITAEQRWRSGVFIKNRNCEARVYQSIRKNYIHIEVNGNKLERRSYLYTIRETFRKLHIPFPEMKIKQEVIYKGQWIDYTTLSKLEEKNKPYYHIELDEDLPITDILNGYSLENNRLGPTKTIKLFLASSSELETERDQFEIFINRENKALNEKGIFIRLEIWEDAIDAMSKTRLQDEYNVLVKNSDIFISLFFTKVGKYTLEEFETAFGQFKETGKPVVYTYFKAADINTEDITGEINSLLDFKKKLADLGHFRTIYQDINDLQRQFKLQLEKILPLL